MKRHILCLETAYDKRYENRRTMVPVLELLERVDRVRHIHFSCHTKTEFNFNLQQFKSDANFKILYLAAHGSANTLHLANGDTVTLEDLAQLMGERFKGWQVHLGGCEVLDKNKAAAQEFIIATGVTFLTGYTKWVNWMPSAALEMLWFSALQSDADIQGIWQDFKKTHISLVQLNGMKAVSPR